MKNIIISALVLSITVSCGTYQNFNTQKFTRLKELSYDLDYVKQQETNLNNTFDDIQPVKKQQLFIEKFKISETLYQKKECPYNSKSIGNSDLNISSKIELISDSDKLNLELGIPDSTQLKKAIDNGNLVYVTINGTEYKLENSVYNKEQGNIQGNLIRSDWKNEITSDQSAIVLWVDEYTIVSGNKVQIQHESILNMEVLKSKNHTDFWRIYKNLNANSNINQDGNLKSLGVLFILFGLGSLGFALSFVSLGIFGPTTINNSDSKKSIIFSLVGFLLVIVGIGLLFS